jgi:hypothetical protein
LWGKERHTLEDKNGLSGRIWYLPISVFLRQIHPLNLALGIVLDPVWFIF